MISPPLFGSKRQTDCRGSAGAVEGELQVAHVGTIRGQKRLTFVFLDEEEDWRTDRGRRIKLGKDR